MTQGMENSAREPSRRGGDAAWRQWMREFGRHVRRVREFVGMSQQQLARHAGVSQGAVSRFEAGRGMSTPFLGILKINMALARALRTVDQVTLSDDVRRFLRQMEFVSAPGAGDAPPHPGGVPLPDIALTANRELEAVLRRYRELPERRRAAVVAALTALLDAMHD